MVIIFFYICTFFHISIQLKESEYFTRGAPRGLLYPGDSSDVVPPVLIPNTEVKRISWENTYSFGIGKIPHRRDLKEYF